LKAKVLQLREDQASQANQEIRKDQAAQAERAQKIRTYNFPQDRITDHRIKKSWHNIEKITSGNLRKNN